MKNKPSSSDNNKNDYDSTFDVYSTTAESTVYKDYVGGLHSEFDYIRTEAYDHVMDLCAIERFVEDVLSTSKPAFKVAHDKKGRGGISPTTLGNKLKIRFNHLKNMLDRKAVQSEICGYRLSPNVNLYFDTLPDKGFWFSEPYFADVDGKFGAEHFNDFIEDIRKNSKGKAYRSELKKRKDEAAANHKSLTDYINTLFAHYARLVVIRLDLAYINDVKNLVTIDVAKAHRKKLLDNIRHKPTIFHDIVGYAWGLEYGIEKGGYHHHFFFFFNGEHRQQDMNIAEAIGDYWRDVITDGKGRYYNCNKEKFKYRYLGIGVINNFDTDLRWNLIEKAAPYITKKGLFFSLKSYDGTQKSVRTFGKGEIEKLPPRDSDKPRLGRPRSKMASPKG